MPTSTRIAAVAAALAASAAVPTLAEAATVPMRGVVSGSPYGASAGQMAIPVLFSKTTARAAGLKSPVGVIIVKRTQQVKLPGGAGYTLPVNLRTGDRFKGFGEVNALQQKVFYPRIVFAKASVYFRSTELSLSELSVAVESLRKSLADLQAQLTTLQNGTIKAFQDVYAQLADLRKQLAALAALKVPDFQAQIDALNKKLNDLIAGLPDFSKFALLTQLPDLTQYAKLTDLTGFLTAADLTPYALAADVTTAINGLQGQINALPTRAGVTTAINGAVNPVKAKVNEVVGNVNAICTAIKTLIPATTCTTITTLP
jgi:hypothetical protein